MILAGIDEAGYGPMLGPLVVSVAVFRLPGTGPSPDLWKVLAPVVSRSVKARSIPVNDSKKLFQQKRGLTHLEEGILPFLELRYPSCPRDFRTLIGTVARRAGKDATAYLDHYPWYRDRNVALPTDTFTGAVRRLASRLEERLKATSVEFIGLAAFPVEVVEFNEQLQAEETKSGVSFLAVGDFLKRLWNQFQDEETEVVVDRQGGRKHYAPLLFSGLKPRGIRIEEQTGERSCYLLTRPRSGGNKRPSFRVTFSTECEQKYLPVALASMLSKYIRELHMILFNEFWREHQEDLKPTAGYFTDARRFLSDTAGLRRRLGVDESLLIRRK